MVSATRRSGIELLAQLVEVRDLHVGAEPHAARVRRERAEDQLHQRGLAGAVRADQAEAVAAHACAATDRVDDALLAEALGDVVKLGDQLAGALAGVDRQLARCPSALAPRGALLAQALEPPHAAFVARAARLDALADPHFLLRPELVELAVARPLRPRAARSCALRKRRSCREASAARPRSSSTMRVATRSRNARSCVITIDGAAFAAAAPPAARCRRCRDGWSARRAAAGRARSANASASAARLRSPPEAVSGGRLGARSSRS